MYMEARVQIWLWIKAVYQNWMGPAYSNAAPEDYLQLEVQQCFKKDFGLDPSIFCIIKSQLHITVEEPTIDTTA
jgi:hypothetical protein